MMSRKMAFGVALVGLAGLAGYRTVRADAPVGRYTMPVAGTVYDTRTRLTWQQNVDANTYTWADATVYCRNLTLAGGGWRLPSVKELFTIVDGRQTHPAIDRIFFPNSPVGYFWSSSPRSGNPTAAWKVDFTIGYWYWGSMTAMYPVRCVR